ncbi:hypothetical protein [Vibrio sp. 99-8-1]|uniref:hypothetical protein n=1 Tax=Vibrio sp. 99-8-1 TaxID=2607602 RepID=UPI001493B074|nr:hypothetical protein [Vibrio sp. 99-8-1]NOI67782.1 hypothetical protein [Vibrio sp. 99-8-1]
MITDDKKRNFINYLARGLSPSFCFDMANVKKDPNIRADFITEIFEDVECQEYLLYLMKDRIYGELYDAGASLEDRYIPI